MYIDTHTKESMEKTVCEYLGVKKKRLEELFKEISRYKKPIDDKIGEGFIRAFIYSNPSKEVIDEILFFHLSRRLNEDKNFRSDNLYNVLTKDTSISRFLKKYDIFFEMKNNHLELFYRGEPKKIKDLCVGENSHVEYRMGAFKNQKDICVNGLAFKDLIYKSSFIGDFRKAPEFIREILEALERKDILDDYERNSTYYCLEYRVPIERVIFDEKERLSLEEKRYEILVHVLMRLYNYYKYNKVDENEVNDDKMGHIGNVVLRLEDNDVIEEKCFIAAEKL